MEIAPYHPFKSEKAKMRSLTLYDNEAKKWPVDSETRMVVTSYGQTVNSDSGQLPLVYDPSSSCNTSPSVSHL